MDAVFKALADPTRRALLDRLYARNGQTLNELCEEMGMTRQAVTQHLGVLEQAALVVIVWQGREKRHFLNAAPLHNIYARWLGKYDQMRLHALEDLKHRLETETSKDKPQEDGDA